MRMFYADIVQVNRIERHLYCFKHDELKNNIHTIHLNFSLPVILRYSRSRIVNVCPFK